jgi:hypothetical protein
MSPQICTRMFLAALFITAKTWKQSKCLSLNKWINGTQHTPIVDYHTPLKGWSSNTHHNMGEPWRNTSCEINYSISMHTVSFYSYEMSRLGQCIETKSRLMLLQAGLRISFGDDENVLILISDDCTMLCIH